MSRFRSRSAACRKVFGDGEDAIHAFGPADLAYRRWRVRVAGRSVRLRQVDPDADHGRALAAERRRDPGRRARGRRPAHRHRHHVPGQHAGAVAHGPGQCRAAARAPRPRRRRLFRPHHGAACLGAARRLRDALPLRALRRHAAARRLLPGDGARAGHASPRRAARQARRHDPREHPHRPAVAVDARSGRPWSSSPTRSRRRCSCRAGSA